MWRPGILDRYLAREVLGAVGAAVGLFAFVLLASNALRDLLGLLSAGRLSLLVAAQLLGLLVPYVISYALPLGFLAGTMIVLGRLAADYELVAMRGAGLSLWRLAAPILALAAVGAGLSAIFNAWAGPSARATYRSVLADVVRTDPLRFIVPGVMIHDIRGYIIYAADDDGTRLRDLWIWELDDADRVTRVLRAATGEFRYDATAEALVIDIRDVAVELRDQDHPDESQRLFPTLQIERTEVALPLRDLLAGAGQLERPDYLNHAELAAQIDERRAALAALPPGTDGEERNRLERQALAYEYQLHKNYANGLTAFSLAFLGLPLGLVVRRRESYAMLGLALGLAMTYYFGTVLVDWVRERPRLYPQYLIWLPNLIALALGAWLLHRANRR